MARERAEHKLIASNRRARHEYEILERIECGIALVGTEVKSLRGGKCQIEQAFARVRRGELWLHAAHIPEYAMGTAFNHEPTRDRKLLLRKREIARWDKRLREKGLTIVPLSIHFQGHLVKVEMALARGKKLHDKRQSARERDTKREIERALSRRR